MQITAATLYPFANPESIFFTQLKSDSSFVVNLTMPKEEMIKRFLYKKTYFYLVIIYCFWLFTTVFSNCGFDGSSY